MKRCSLRYLTALVLVFRGQRKRKKKDSLVALTIDMGAPGATDDLTKAPNIAKETTNENIRLKAKLKVAE